jgi:hypothetical protein
MVPRSELLSATSEGKARQDEVQAKEKDLAWLQEQLNRAQEQLTAARAEEAKLQSALHDMVPKSDLEAAKAHSLELEKAARAEVQKHRDALGALSEKLSAVESEKATSLNTIQVQTLEYRTTMVLTLALNLFFFECREWLIGHSFWRLWQKSKL